MPPSIRIQANVIADLNKMHTLHKGQIAILSALFGRHCRLIFCQCGRKFGKTEAAAYAAWRWGNTYPNQAMYYIAPFQNQAKEIVWASNRLQNFGPKGWIKKILNNEMRIIFWNDSFIKLCGADNAEALRGINPDFVIYDEYKDFNPDFHAGFGPNLLSNRAPLFAIGTPPENDIKPSEINYFNLAEEARIRENGFFYTGPSWERDNDPEFIKELDVVKQILLARGDWDVWEREYGARFVKGGARSIFPMYNKERHTRTHSYLHHLVTDNPDRFEFWVGADPGTKACFAVGFYAIDRYSAKVYALDEIYEKDMANTSARSICPRIEAICREFHPYLLDWYGIYDEAALWFYNEISTVSEITWMPSHKALMRTERDEAKPYISMMKDLFNAEALLLSERVVGGAHEIESYQTDKEGRIPKGNDHWIDQVRYVLSASGFTLDAKPPQEDRILRRSDKLSIYSEDPYNEDYEVNIDAYL